MLLKATKDIVGAQLLGQKRAWAGPTQLGVYRYCLMSVANSSAICLQNFHVV